MIASTNYGVYSLPRELLHIIHSYLPFEDQIVMLKVSRVWRSVSEESLNSSKELSKRFLGYYPEDRYYFNQNQLNFIIELFKTNNFISTIKENNFDCIMGHLSYVARRSKIVSEKEELKDLSLSVDQSFNGYCKHFYINWDPETLKLSKGWDPETLKLSNGTEGGDFLTCLAIGIDVINTSYRSKNLSKVFKLYAFSKFNFERENLISWKWINEEEVKPQYMNRSIAYALNFQLKMYISHLTRLNMVALSKISRIEDIPSKLFFQCNKNGRITDETNNDNPILSIEIENVMVSGQNMPILTWKSSDYHEDKEKFCKITDLMSWSVFSSTSEKLAEKLGIQIREAKS